MDNFKWDLLHVSVVMIRMRKKMFGNSGGLRFNVSFVDRASMLNLCLRRRLVSPIGIVNGSGYTVSCRLLTFLLLQVNIM